MAATYTTADRVSSLLLYTQVDSSGTSTERKEFDETSNPTLDEVNDTIEEIEDLIDEYCEMSWRLNTRTTPEYHDYITRGFRGRYVDRSGKGIFSFSPKKKYVRTLDTGQSDALEVFDGTSWVDFLTTYTEGIAMYEDDYWINYDENMIYLFNHFPRVGKNMIRITYRWGKTSVPNGIKYACSLLTAAQINERYEMYKEVSKDTSPAINQSNQWRERAYKILDQYGLVEVEVL